MLHRLFSTVYNSLRPTDQSRKRRRSESEQLGLPPYNYQARLKMSNPSADAADIKILGQSSSQQPSTSKDETCSLFKTLKIKGPIRSGLVNENSKDDDDVRIIPSQCPPSTSNAVFNRPPLTSKQNTGSVAMSVPSKMRKTLSGPTADALLANTKWQQPKKLSNNHLRYRPNFVSTSTPRQLSNCRKVSQESKTIRKDYEDKMNYKKMIEMYLSKDTPSRRILIPHQIKTPEFIDLTLTESEICNELEIAPKPMKSLFSSTPRIANPFKKPEIIQDDDDVQYVQSVPRINSFKDALAERKMFKLGHQSFKKSYQERTVIKLKEIEDTKIRIGLAEKKSKEIFQDNYISSVDKSLSRFDLQKLEDEIPFIEDEEILPEIPEDGIQIVDRALYPAPANEVLVSGFNADISRKDIQTLGDRNWLNDEIINFYMELIRERGTLDNYPKVHSFNTFFYPKLRQSGHTVLKRWTRKIDIFAHDIIVVPIHLEVHWCMSILDMKNKTAYYYDSMLANNTLVLKLLMKYLEDESLDKRKVPYDTSGWKLIQDKDIPQQHNGYDCGVFACMFAEAASRRSKFLFTQADMPSLRRRMVYEILTKKLLT